MGNVPAPKYGLRKYMEGMLDYLGVPAQGELRMSLANATDNSLPSMFVEMTKAFAEIMEDDTILNNVRVQMPDGKEVSYSEAMSYAEKMKAPPEPTKENTVSDENRFKSKSVRYENASEPFNPRPGGRSRSTRRR